MIKFGIKLVLYLVFGIGIIGGGLFLYLNGLQYTDVDRVEISGLSNIKSDSFVVNGIIYINNPSNALVPIKIIQYDVYLERTGEKIGSGTIPAVAVASRKVTPIAIAQKVNWIPTSKLAADLIIEEEVTAHIIGNVTLDLPKVDQYPIEFSADFDMKEYVLQFVPVDVRDEMGTLNEVTGERRDKSAANPNEETTANSVDPVGGLLS